MEEVLPALIFRLLLIDLIHWRLESLRLLLVFRVSSLLHLLYFLHLLFMCHGCYVSPLGKVFSEFILQVDLLLFL